MTSRFNPHPTRRLGAIKLLFLALPVTWCFNPHPTRRLGAIAIAGLTRISIKCFNPHPTRRLGAMVPDAGLLLQSPCQRHLRGGVQFASSGFRGGGASRAVYFGISLPPGLDFGMGISIF